jgi:ribosome-associated protein
VEAPEKDMTGAAAPEDAATDAAVEVTKDTEGGAAIPAPEETAASLLEAVSRRDRQRDPEQMVDIETIHARARLAAEAASSVKAEDIVILDMHELVTYTDYLVICTGRNVRLTKRIADEVAFKLKQEYKILPAGSEGVGDGEWVLLDYLDFMVHIFTPEAREFYRLDVLWKQAPAETVE